MVPQSAAFDLSLTTAPTGHEDCATHKMTICPKYLLAQSSNMALVEIAMISGYEADKSHLNSLIVSDCCGGE